LCCAEKAALHWVPASQLPPPAEGDESTDALAAEARRSLQAQAKQVSAALGGSCQVLRRSISDILCGA